MTNTFVAEWVKLFPVTTDADKEIMNDQFNFLPSYSGYWLDDEDEGNEFEIVKDESQQTSYGTTQTVKYVFTNTDGVEGVTRAEMRLGDFHGRVAEFAHWWLSQDVTKLNEYITRANRSYLGGDFDGWACESDAEYRDVLLQWLIFGKVVYS